MKRIKFILIHLVCLIPFSVWAEQRSLNDNWLFYLGDPSSAHLSTYDAASWQSLNLPHDWAYERGYSEDGAQKDKGGYASGGIGWYRRRLDLTEAEQKSQKVVLAFEAVYRNAEVWLNGHWLGKCPYGYLPFAYDITPYLKKAGNTIAVRVDNSLEPSARWYHGCGIYGNVSLRTYQSAFFNDGGTFVAKSDSRGNLELSSDITILPGGKSSTMHLVACLMDTKGQEQNRYVSGPISQSCRQSLKMKIDDPLQWSPERPSLYQLQLQLIDAEGKLCDERHLRIGFRDFDWSIEQGFFLNGCPFKLRGVCEHLEGGPTGAICTPQLLRWKLQLLKDMGCNAIRTAHNPQLPIFYDLCDEMGLLVMDEIFDGWKRKADYDYGMQAFAQHWEKDLRTIIRRDRNHPSVFLYSIGNETRGPMASAMVQVCHEEDSTRQVTSGTAESSLMDIYGVNGHSEDKHFLESFIPKQRPFIATENPHTWQVRGFYRSQTWYRDGYKPAKMMWIPNLTEQEIFTYDWTAPENKRNHKQIFNSSYDNATVRVTARHILEALRDKPWFSGSFRWTGFDYLGEAGYVHGGWPFRAFQSGALDLAGFPKDLYYLYQSEWTTRDMVHILPHWSHPMMELGTKIPVWVYTSGDEVELFLNGRSLGRQQKGMAWDKMQCEFMVPWTPGKIEAVAYRDGKEIARTAQITSDTPSRIGIEMENGHLKADGSDISILTFRQLDARGTLYPYGENRVHVVISGPARMLSFENGSPVDTECNFQARSRRCFFGLNRAFVQSTGGDVNDPVSIMVCAICGDKKLKQSNLITINSEELSLRGKLPKRQLNIFYTTDGSIPTNKSLRYRKAFPIKAGTTVRSAIYDGDSLLVQMSERFGPNEGLYWGNFGDNTYGALGEQAEQMLLKACSVGHEGEGAFGGAYVVPTPGQGKILWYQENDGGKTQGTLTIRYAQQTTSEKTIMALYHNDKLVENIVFENTGSSHSHWKEKKVKVTIYPGANQFSLRSVSDEFSPSIDQVKLQ